MGRTTLLQVMEILATGSRAPLSCSGTVTTVPLPHDARHVRRRAIALKDGRKVLIDWPEPVMLAHGDALVLEDGEHVLVDAALEDLLEVRGRDATHLTELAWHLGNRHLPAEIRADCIHILDDHVILAMLEKLGAVVARVRRPFTPVRGAYAASAGVASHDHAHHHE